MHDLGMWDPIGNDHTAPTFYWLTCRDCDSYQILTKDLFHEWFIAGEYNGVVEKAEDLLKVKKIVRPWKLFVTPREICRNVDDIIDRNNFIDEDIDKDLRKKRLMEYFLSKIHKNERCLANPRVDKGIINRIMKYYGFKRRK